ncbi:hypothetical protein SLEP1_g46070 [Rubroshorea leprosula]|uniref:Uncharacterized protein n=1 Tax=Rubroshorea leprosula TaxID=152421 RepID=A0AAV5LL85_9ROSI|nr:hypothetical protein SLEP1_g46070 [Rubroshorea leprosula]
MLIQIPRTNHIAYMIGVKKKLSKQFLLYLDKTRAKTYPYANCNYFEGCHVVKLYFSFGNWCSTLPLGL